MKLATDKQINYLCDLASEVEYIRKRDTAGAIKGLPEYIDWQVERNKGVTTLDASKRIDAYKSIIRASRAIFVLFNLR